MSKETQENTCTTIGCPAECCHDTHIEMTLNEFVVFIEQHPYLLLNKELWHFGSVEQLQYAIATKKFTKKNQITYATQYPLHKGQIRRNEHGEITVTNKTTTVLLHSERLEVTLIKHFKARVYVVLKGSCPNLDENHNCMIYENRPEACRNFKFLGDMCARIRTKRKTMHLIPIGDLTILPNTNS